MRFELSPSSQQRNQRSVKYAVGRWAALAALVVGAGVALAVPLLIEHSPPARGEQPELQPRSAPAPVAPGDTSVPDASAMVGHKRDPDAEPAPTF